MRFKVEEVSGVYLVMDKKQTLCYSEIESNATLIAKMMNKHYLSQQAGFTVLTKPEALSNNKKENP